MVVQPGFWYARERYGHQHVTIVEVNDDLKHVWMIGCEGWIEIANFDLIRPVPPVYAVEGDDP